MGNIHECVLFRLISENVFVCNFYIADKLMAELLLQTFGIHSVGWKIFLVLSWCKMTKNLRLKKNSDWSAKNSEISVSAERVCFYREIKSIVFDNLLMLTFYKDMSQII